MNPIKLWLVAASPYIAGVLIVLAIVGGFKFVAREREIGAQKVLLHVADSTHKADSVQSVTASVEASNAARVADSLRAKGIQQVAAAKAQEAHTQAAAKAAGDERDAATRLLQDSLASISALRAEVERLVVSGRADSLAAAQQRDADRRAITALLRAIEVDSSAISKGLAATNAAIQRAAASEAQVRLLRAQMPSGVARWTERIVLGGAIAYFAVVRK